MHTQVLTDGLSLCAASIQGSRVRQEDYYICKQKEGRTIAVVCDGMGGMGSGNIASRFAAEQMAEALEKVKLTESMHSFWKQELERLDDGVFGLRDSSGVRLKAGTTMVAVLLQDGKLHWFSVGDSRLFFMREHRLHCVTREHNYALLAEEKSCEKKGEQLISYLGMGAAELFDGSNASFMTRRGDKLLLCTDGLSRTLPQEKIVDIMDNGKNPEAVCDDFREALEAKKYTGQDNATWVIISVDSAAVLSLRG